MEAIGKWDKAEAAYRTYYQIATDLKNEGLTAESEWRLGELLRRRGEYLRARPFLEEALSRYQALEDRPGICAVLSSLGHISLNQGEYAKALELCQRRMKIAEAMNDTKLLGSAVSFMGHIRFYQGDYGSAMECYQRQLKIVQGIGDVFAESVVIGNIGNVYHHQGDYTQAMACYQRKLMLAETMGDKPGIGLSLGNIGIIHKIRGEFGLAMECYQQYLKIAESLGDRKNMGILLGNLGALHYIVRGYARAEECLDKAIAINGEIGQQYHLCENLSQKAEMCLGLGRIDEAEVLARKAAQTARAIDRRDLAFMSDALALMAEGRRDRDGAARQIERLLEEAGEEAQRAYALFALWKVTGQEGCRNQALEIYQGLDRQSPSSEWRRFIEELRSGSGRD